MEKKYFILKLEPYENYISEPLSETELKEALKKYPFEDIQNRKVVITQSISVNVDYSFA